MKTNEGISVEEARSCFLCGSDGVLLYENLRDRLFSAPGIWSLLKCPDCHLVWLNPRPISTDIRKLYGEYYTHNRTSSAPQISSLRVAIRNAILEAHMGYKNLNNNKLLKGFGKPFSLIKPIKERVRLSVMYLEGHNTGTLLDVGCGNGQFLVKMRGLGWKVSGVDPDEQSVEFAQKNFDLDIKKETMDQIHFPDSTFDAITMNHVIEHLVDPIRTLNECARVLKPNGKLIILTPSIESLGSWLFKKNWLHLDPPRHLCLFTSFTLKKCVEGAGLKVFELRTSANSANWMWVNSHLIQRDGSIQGGFPKKQGLWLRLNGIAFQITESALCLRKDLGEEVVLLATKKEVANKIDDRSKFL